MPSWFPPRSIAYRSIAYRSIAFFCGILITLLPASARAEDGKFHFESDIRPILREYCFDCHGATDEVEGNLDLRLVHFMQAGGDSGPAIASGQPEESLLIQRVVDGDMPPGETRVSDDKIAILKSWIAQGSPTLRPEPETIGPGIPITEEERSYWAYQPIRRPEIAASTTPNPHAQRIRTPIDALLANAMPDGLTFAPDADRFTLIKRLYDDLIGLPPSAEELDRWMQAPEPDWYENLVDELLRSPHYGERWARHWLDAAGYADSEGYTISDQARPWAWQYRDYVIRSLNEDKPIDQFIAEQLAGDELAGPKQGDWTKQQIEYLTATGFLRMAADGTGSGDNSAEARNKTIADTLQIVGSTLLGSSFNCAQCHDHRYDPISHNDYFALRAVFEPALDWQAWQTPQQRQVSLYTEADRQAAAALEQEVQTVASEKNAKQAEFMKQALDQELAKFEDPLKSQLRTAYETPAAERTDEQKSLLDKNPSVNITPGVLYQYLPKAAEELKTYDSKIAEIRARKTPETFVRALVESPSHVPVTKLFHRGDHNQPKQTILPAAPAVTTAEGQRIQFPENDPSLPTTGRRLAFAKWLCSEENPLTARALANRVWLHHFGRGIVATPGEFGKLGAAPSHPELLDWLASELMQNGWSLKHLHRTILTSTAWRQSSQPNSKCFELDPDNQYYTRKPLRRIDAEVLRDCVLATAGQLDRTQFGSPVPVTEDDTGQVHIDGSQPRRSIYVTARRSQPVAMLQSFDAPVMSVNCDVRPDSTVATQSLVMLNGAVSLDMAKQIAQQVINTPVERDETDFSQWTKSLPEPAAPAWQYGTGTFDEKSGGIANFTPLPHFTGTQWQGGSNLPDSHFGWVLISAGGGHPGNANFPAIRRWTAPASGTITVRGTLSHGNENGDGVRARIVMSNQTLGDWKAHNNSTTTEISNEIPVESGQQIDFATDCIAHETSDSFGWTVTLTFTDASGNVATFDSQKQFHGPLPASESYAHLPAWIISAWRRVLLREPNNGEMAAAMELATNQLNLLHRSPQSLAEGMTPARQVLTNICQMLINTNEFLYIE